MSKKSIRKVVLLIPCLLLPIQSYSQDQRQSDKKEHVSGILVRTNKDNGSMDMMTKSSTHPDKETGYTFHYDEKTKVLRSDGTPGDLNDVKAGSVVKLTVKNVDGESRATVIMLQGSCDQGTCARSNCNKQCNSSHCKCPKS
jgi:hypothetical protein